MSKGDVRRLMDEIRVGEYIRTNGGNIYQIRKIEKSISAIGRTAYWVKEFYLLKEDIKSHSKNIIDLISPRDFVNTEYVVYVSEKNKKVYTELDNEISENEILNILTHEMYEQNCYKVGED